MEHLYIARQYQGKGMGSAVLGSIVADANARSTLVKVGAVRNSDSNRFYQRHGFSKIDEAQWDRSR
uniref:GNAT family N-acetyltransferase n=1 Tax=Paraburkholderia dilworthii TaxID=948106 RepID=UPI0009FDE7DA|nr:GNAT family N-acetyltransferase [Paraburkholderia dilworthii]